MSEKKLTNLAQLEMLAIRTKSEQDALAAEIAAIAEIGGEPNVIETVKVNGVALTPTNKAVDVTVPTKVSDITNDSNFQTEAQVEAAINAKVASTYKAGGTKASVAELPELEEENEGFVYNMSAAFTTTADFVEGAGKRHPAGANVAIVKVGTAYKYDVLAGFVDLSGYAEKVSGATAGNFAALDANGNLTDSGKKASDFIEDISGKADKVASATNGNFAGLDANGNLTDSGKKAADFVAAETGKRLMTTAEGTKLSGISASANKTEASNSNGYIKIDGTETKVYELPDSVLHDTDMATDQEVQAMLDEVFGSDED